MVRFNKAKEVTGKIWVRTVNGIAHVEAKQTPQGIWVYGNNKTRHTESFTEEVSQFNKGGYRALL